jgi:hypothetical protein
VRRPWPARGRVARCGAPTRRARQTLALGGGLAAALLLGACGGLKAADLFLVQRSGGVPGAALTLLVNEEGGVRCNGAPERKLDDAQLVEARDIQEALHDPASKHVALAPAPGSVFSYRARLESGSVSFSDNSPRQPTVFRRLALFVLRTAQRVCQLPL